MMSLARGGVALLGLAAVLTGPAGAFDRRFPDWPCVQVRVPSLSAGSVWTGPPIDDALNVWRNDSEINALVERIAVRRTPLDEAERAVADFLGKAGDAKAEKARLMVAGLYETLNRERADVISGLERLTRRQRDFASSIESDAAKLRDLQAKPDADRNALTELTTKVQWSTRIFEERRKSVRYACEVPVLIEQRFFLLTRAAQRDLG
ncbi:hypothetical protein [Terrihabitans sp. B22-R8]|uniref:hypothetical protein n=1 Tax=Terrihabitans sp. B22-R8 TaxID=3425128 RepID=UPI00403D1144